MLFEVVQGESVSLVGASIRTSHADAARDIPAFWHKVTSEGLLSGVSSSEPETIYAVYTELEDEWRGAYTMLLAVSVPPGTPAPEGLVSLDVPARRVARTSVVEESPQSIVDAWEHIWHRWPRRDMRAYETDLEIHRRDKEGNCVAEILLGIKD